MGEIIIFKCPNCDNKIEIYEGIGEMWAAFNIDVFYPPKKGCCFNFYYKLDKNIIEDVHKFVKESSNAAVVEYGLKSYICKNCGKIESNLYFKIKGNNKTYTPKYNCKCGGEYKKLTKKEQHNITCRKCANKMVRILSGFWD